MDKLGESAHDNIGINKRNQHGPNSNAVIDPTPSRGFIYWRTFLLFIMMGCGASWIFPNALAQQIPVFQATLPGGLCIATYMNAATNFSFVCSVSYVALNNAFGPFPHRICVPILLTLGAIGAFLAAATYTVVVNGIPIMLLICCALGGGVGGLSNVVMNPFITRFKNDFISASRSGTSVGTLLTALLAVVQNPGSADDGRFSTSTYLAIFGAFLSFPIVAYAIIVHYRLGLRESTVDPMQFREIADTSEHDCEFVGRRTALDSSVGYNCDHDANIVNAVMSPMATRRSNSPAEENATESLKPETIVAAIFKQFQYSNITGEYHENPKSLLNIVSCGLRTYLDRHPWLLHAMPYMCSIGWVNLNQWGILSAVVPFAMASVSKHGGSLTLSIAYQFGALGLLAGDLSTVYFRVPLHVCVIVFTISALILYGCALHLISSTSSAAPPLLIVVWTISRYFEAHVSTSTYRCIATEFPIEHREAAARACGLTDQVCTTLGTIISTTIISSYGNC